MLLSGGLKVNAAPTIQVGDFNGARGSVRTVAIPRWVISSSQRSQLRCWDGEDKLAMKGYRPCTDLGLWRHFGSDMWKKKWSSHNPHLTRFVTEKWIHMKGKQSMHIGCEDSSLAEAKPICFAFFISRARTELLIQWITLLSCHRLAITEI